MDLFILVKKRRRKTGEQASFGITKALESAGFSSGRMKTGTPKVDGRSLDFSIMESQPGDKDPEKFSFSDDTKPLKTARLFFDCTNKQHTISKSDLIGPQCSMAQ